MTLTEDDKKFLIETIGDIVNAATLSIQQSITNMVTQQAILSSDIQSFDESFIRLEVDVKDIKMHAASLSHSTMTLKHQIAKDRKKDTKRLDAIESVVEELKRKITASANS